MSDSKETAKRKSSARGAEQAEDIDTGAFQKAKKSAVAWVLDDDAMYRFGRASRADGPIRSDDERLDWNHLPWHQAGRYVVGIDADASWSWDASEIGGAHLIVIVTRAASREGLADIASKGISYVFAGDAEVDMGSALETLRRLFGIERVLFAVCG